MHGGQLGQLAATRAILERAQRKARALGGQLQSDRVRVDAMAHLRDDARGEIDARAIGTHQRQAHESVPQREPIVEAHALRVARRQLARVEHQTAHPCAKGLRDDDLES